MCLPESVHFERGIGVNVVVKPPLHRHIPVAHTMTHFHTEIAVIAVNVLDCLEVIIQFCAWIRTETYVSYVYQGHHHHYQPKIH